MTPPTWLKQGVLAHHMPSRTIFVPARLYARNGSHQLTDSAGDEYKLSECSELRLDHMRGVALMITDSAPITVYPNARGLIVTDGHRKLLVIPNATNAIDDEQAKAAAQSLARMFDGAIYSEEVTV